MQEPNRRKPKQARSLRTYDALLDAAGNLLGEIGIENVSTNLICERAGVTPPALYRYFEDKYAVVEALAERLMERQNVILEAWVEHYRGQDLDTIAGGVKNLLRDLHEVTVSTAGALWTMRALNVMPKLAHIRLASHNYVTDLLTGIYHPHLPHVPYDVLRRRTRLSVEIAYSVDEMLKEGEADPDTLFEDIDHVFRAMFKYPDYRRGEAG